MSASSISSFFFPRRLSLPPAVTGGKVEAEALLLVSLLLTPLHAAGCGRVDDEDGDRDRDGDRSGSLSGVAPRLLRLPPSGRGGAGEAVLRSNRWSRTRTLEFPVTADRNISPNDLRRLWRPQPPPPPPPPAASAANPRSALGAGALTATTAAAYAFASYRCGDGTGTLP